MKIYFKYFILFLIVNTGQWMIPQKANAQLSIDFQIFYDDLSPYGNWVDNSDYGYVWVPDVSPGFTPYSTNGHWVYTDYGWTWVSNYSWGWAPFHYGRWYFDPMYGPVWVPGNEWGPGWVTWRRSNGYYGWAPIGPGISIDFAYSSGYNLPYNEWTFVRDRDFGRTNIYNYYVNESNYTTIINNSTVINNIQVEPSSYTKYNTGPDRIDVQRQTGTSFSPVTIKQRNNPGQNLSNNELQLYRPKVERNNNVSNKPAPINVVGWKDIKPTAQRNTRTQQQKSTQSEKQQPAQQRNEQPIRKQPQKSIEQPTQQKRNDQPVKQQPAQQQRNDQPVKQQPAQQQRNDRPVKQQPVQQQRNDQPVRQQPAQQQRNDQPVKQQPAQQQRNDKPVRQQPPQQQSNDKPAGQQPSQPKPDNQPVKQQPSQQKPKDQPAKQQPIKEKQTKNSGTI